MNTNWMNNKTVIITGASGGMGKGVAERLIKEHGCTVIGIARSEEKMKKVVEELGEYADKFSYQLFDVSVEQNWIDFVTYLRDNNIHPDVLINNAGILPKFDRFQNYTIDYIKKAMDITSIRQFIQSMLFCRCFLSHQHPQSSTLTLLRLL